MSGVKTFEVTVTIQVEAPSAEDAGEYLSHVVAHIRRELFQRHGLIGHRAATTSFGVDEPREVGPGCCYDAEFFDVDIPSMRR